MNVVAVFLEILEKYSDFVNSDGCIGRKYLIFEPMKMNLNVKILDLC